MPDADQGIALFRPAMATIREDMAQLGRFTPQPDEDPGRAIAVRVIATGPRLIPANKPSSRQR